MNKVKITAIRQTVYPDLMAKYENPIEHTCDVEEGQQWISVNGKRPDGMCPSAWESMREFVESLAKGDGNFYDGWMKNPMSAMPLRQSLMFSPDHHTKSSSVAGWRLWKYL